MRWLNNACDLGGFHPSSDGADSELCYFNDGELVKYMIHLLVLLSKHQSLLICRFYFILVRFVRKSQCLKLCIIA